VALAAWHLSPLYDATLRSTAIHELEHAMFLATGLLFWSH
jgi:cytochrome c oxidase assembly factor CtaG